jgi:hypothetical protein
MPYLPATASLAAAHKGKVGNIRAAALRQTKEDRITEIVILNFEEECLKFDQQNKEQLGYVGK